MNTLLDPPTTGSVATRSNRPRPARILYVEDDDSVRDLISKTLTRSGYAVTLAVDGMEGWEELRSGQFDLLITDNEMPAMTGLELVTKARLEGLEIPIIVASGSIDVFAGPAAPRLHLAAALQKPFAVDELLSAVRQALPPSRDLNQASVSSTFAWILSHVEPVRHWGINE
jgi:CheY-like chemotaxis protein